MPGPTLHGNSGPWSTGTREIGRRFDCDRIHAVVNKHRVGVQVERKFGDEVGADVGFH